MSFRHARKWFWTLVLFLLNTTWLRADDVWVGNEVVTKRGVPKINWTDANGQAVDVGPFDDGYHVTVPAEKGKVVQLEWNEKSRWIAKDEVLRVDEGTELLVGIIAAGGIIIILFGFRWFSSGNTQSPPVGATRKSGRI